MTSLHTFLDGSSDINIHELCHESYILLTEITNKQSLKFILIRFSTTIIRLTYKHNPFCTCMFSELPYKSAATVNISQRTNFLPHILTISSEKPVSLCSRPKCLGYIYMPRDVTFTKVKKKKDKENGCSFVTRKRLLGSNQMVIVLKFLHYQITFVTTS